MIDNTKNIRTDYRRPEMNYWALEEEGPLCGISPIGDDDDEW